MRIDVLNMMVVLTLRYLYSEKVVGKKLLYTSNRHIPVRGIFDLLTLQTPLNINLGTRNLRSAENFGGPTYSTNLVFLGAPGANRQGRGQKGSHQLLKVTPFYSK